MIKFALFFKKLISGRGWSLLEIEPSKSQIKPKNQKPTKIKRSLVKFTGAKKNKKLQSKDDFLLVLMRLRLELPFIAQIMEIEYYISMLKYIQNVDTTS